MKEYNIKTYKMAKRHSIPKSLRVKVWNHYIGIKRGTAPCFVRCGTKINQITFEVGHVKSVAHGGSNSLENLRPICITCNRSMGTQNMNEFIQMYGFHKKQSWLRRFYFFFRFP